MLVPALLANLVVTLSPINNNHGPILYSVYDNEESWSKQDDALVDGSVPSVEGEVTIQLTLQPGTYAFACFHDENSNGRLDTNILGFPTEYFGISNITRKLWSQPQWSEVKFDIAPDQVVDLHVLMKLQ
jgi:uncharacterized protein (DUF2141 family)